MYAQRMTALVFGVCWLIAFILVWLLHRQWWRVRGVRRALWLVPAIELASVFLWGISSRAQMALPTAVFAVISTLGVTGAIGLVVALPFSGLALTFERIVQAIARRSRRREAVAERPVAAHAEQPAPIVTRPAEEEVDRGRRSFITVAAAALPAFTVGAAGVGVAASYGRTTFPVVPLRYAGLPAELEGLRILHLSDVHIGYFVGLHDLEQTVEDALAQRADIVLVTGDFVDDLPQLPDALRIVDALKPRLGTYASIGNHEYYRGIEEVHRAFDAGPIPLLIEESTSIKVGYSTLHLAGADDPARTGRFNDAKFMRSTVESSLDGMPSESFSILMSHRPEGFDVAAKHGVDLTLSGHYHGGIQLGIGGRAIIQPFRPDVYYWGHYTKGASQLYTSGGVGHWFPFRLNCPPEAPVYVLTRA